MTRGVAETQGWSPPALGGDRGLRDPLRAWARKDDSLSIEQIRTRCLQTSFAERHPGRLRRGRLDHLLIHGERHLRRILAEYARHYNEYRPHQSREQRPPLHEPGQATDMTGRITRMQVVHGLINEYRRAA
ncbi:MAG: integrase core domain-containing protein [Streptosporangiaceae bacterium]